jgi:glycosyltransferase involved in cell wall biosynthesis
MKILFDHQIFGAQRFGGISRYFVELAKNLIKNDNDVNILAPVHFNRHLDDYNREKYIKYNHYIDVNFRGIPRAIQFLNQHLSPCFFRDSKVDLIHETYYNYKSFKSNLPRIVTIHDMTDEVLGRSFGVISSVSKLKKRAVDGADHVICVSKNTQKDLIEIFGISEKKTSVVHHGYSIFKSNGKIESSKPYILFVGNRSYYKNFFGLINAFSKSEKINQYFNLVAFGGTAFSSSELNLINQLRLNGKVFHVSGNDSLLAQYYRGASSFIYPSYYEGFGMPLLEAMYYSCPVVCSNTSCMSEIAGNAAIYFDPSKEDQIINSLELSIFDSEIRQNKIVNGLERVALFSWNKCSIETEKIYKIFT